jgi:DNA polymerase-3 subunit chi
MKVEFHSGVADKLGAACRFLRKAQDAGVTVVVCGDRDSLDRLDLALWTFDPLSFVAHARVKGAEPPAALVPTRTWLVDSAASASSRELLLNLGPAMVEGWEAFGRVVEIVSAEPDDADAGRQRWRQYSAQPGLDLVHHQRAAAT